MATVTKEIETVVEVKTIEVKTEVEYFKLKLSKDELDLITSLLGKSNGNIRENFYDKCIEAGGESKHVDKLDTIPLVETKWHRVRTPSW